MARFLTPPHIVKAMLDLVKEETMRIDSRFLSLPAAPEFFSGDLRRKLEVVDKDMVKASLIGNDMGCWRCRVCMGLTYWKTM